MSFAEIERASDSGEICAAAISKVSNRPTPKSPETTVERIGSEAGNGARRMTVSRIAVPFQSQAIKETGRHAATTMATNRSALKGKRRAIPATRSVATADTYTEVLAKTRILSSLAIGNA
jgi:hypothetical protein